MLPGVSGSTPLPSANRSIPLEGTDPLNPVRGFESLMEHHHAPLVQLDRARSYEGRDESHWEFESPGEHQSTEGRSTVTSGFEPRTTPPGALGSTPGPSAKRPFCTSPTVEASAC